MTMSVLAALGLAGCGGARPGRNGDLRRAPLHGSGCAAVDDAAILIVDGKIAAQARRKTSKRVARISRRLRRRRGGRGFQNSHVHFIEPKFAARRNGPRPSSPRR
jgi:hypothetical protein